MSTVPSNPFTDPNWATNVVDSVERVVGTVREKTTTPLVRVTRGVVYGLFAAILGAVALVLTLIIATRLIQAAFDIVVSTPRAVYLSYFTVGALLTLLGWVLLRKRFETT